MLHSLLPVLLPPDLLAQLGYGIRDALLLRAQQLLLALLQRKSQSRRFPLFSLFSTTPTHLDLLSAQLIEPLVVVLVDVLVERAAALVEARIEAGLRTYYCNPTVLTRSLTCFSSFTRSRRGFCFDDTSRGRFVLSL